MKSALPLLLRTPLPRLLALAALASAQPAAAQDADTAPACPPVTSEPAEREMRFTPRTIEGRRVLLAEGNVDDGAVSRLQRALDGNPDIGAIWLRSSGGAPSIAREAARLIRRSGVETHIPSGWACAGACTYLFMGGILRTIGRDGHFIVQPARGAAGDPEAVAQQAALAVSEETRFLIAMGISRTFLDETMSRMRGDAPPTHWCLSAAELDRYNITPFAFRRD